MYGLNADQSLTSPSGAAISDTTATSHLRTAEHHQKGVDLDLKEPKSIHKNPN